MCVLLALDDITRAYKDGRRKQNGLCTSAPSPGLRVGLPDRKPRQPTPAERAAKEAKEGDPAAAAANLITQSAAAINERRSSRRNDSVCNTTSVRVTDNCRAIVCVVFFGVVQMANGGSGIDITTPMTITTMMTPTKRAAVVRPDPDPDRVRENVHTVKNGNERGRQRAEDRQSSPLNDRPPKRPKRPKRKRMRSQTRSRNRRHKDRLERRLGRAADKEEADKKKKPAAATDADA